MKSQNQEILVHCNQCNLKVPIGQTTYNENKNLICFECYNKIAQGITPEPYKTVQSAESPSKIYYSCNYCGFKFSRSEDFSFTGICINCGKKTAKTEQRVEILKDRKTLLDF